MRQLRLKVFMMDRAAATQHSSHIVLILPITFHGDMTVSEKGNQQPNQPGSRKTGEAGNKM